MDDRLVGRHRWVVVFGVRWGRCPGGVHSHTTYPTFSDARLAQLCATATMAASVMLLQPLRIVCGGTGELRVSTGLAAYCIVTVSFTDNPLGEWYGYPLGWQLSSQVSSMDDRLVDRRWWVAALFCV